MSSSFNIESLYSVKGIICCVTGGATGIGKAVTTALAVNGATVVICGRRKDVTEATAAEINAYASGKVIPIQADVSSKEGVAAFYDEAVKHIDRLDFLVANAGFSANWRDQSSLADPETLEKKLWSVEDADFNKMTSVHVSGPYFLAARFIPLFKKSANPSVCLITSMAAFFLNRAVCELSYAQSKAAETQMTQLLAATLSPFKIRVNSVCPGLFKSQLTTDATGELYSVMSDQIKNIPLERIGSPEEIAGPIIMLASPAGSFMNSASLLVDGGWGINSSARDV